MKVSIKKLSVKTVMVPMKEPHQTASGVISASPLVLIDIKTSCGIKGRSILFTYTPLALKPVATLVKSFESLLEGKSLNPKDVYETLLGRFRLLGTQGFVGMAIAGIDMALWDALAKVREQNLSELLGAKIKPILTYGGIGYDGELKSAQSAERLVKEGFKGLKVKIGYPSIEEDLKVIRAIRSAINPRTALMVDYNQCLSPAEAIRRLNILSHEGLTWVEEPTLAHDYQGHAHITQNVRTPIQCGENWWGLQDMQHAVEAKASTFVMLDVMKIGGVTGWQEAASLAKAKQLKVSSHLWPELSAHLLSATTTAHWLEFCNWWEPILKEPAMFKDGFLTARDVAGSGISWNKKALKAFEV